MSFPKMLRVRQTFDGPRVDDIPGSVRAELSKLNLGAKVQAGETIAITAGSRGIANIAVITRAIVDYCHSIGGKPFIVPAMGSHGGGTAEGQAAILAGYGITEASMGCPVRASMETVVVDSLAQGVPVHFDKLASEADHVIVAGRVKPHTGFVGEIESGLHKMMLIGLGKHEGAKIYHRAIMDYSWMEIVEAVAGAVLKKCKVLCGVGVVENAYDETALIEAVRPEEFGARERMLLQLARQWMPRLPFKKVDLLITENRENIGKATANLQEITAKVNKGEGTLGRLISDPKMYDELVTTIAEIKNGANEAKTFIANAQKIIDQAVQLHGGLGVMSGSMVESLYREIRALRIYEGASEVQKVIIGGLQLQAS